MPDVQVFNDELLDELSEQAKASPRLRQHLNLHSSFSEPCQRLLVAMEPCSYLTPHRHLDPSKPECFVGVRGLVAVVIFNDDGAIRNVFRVGQSGNAKGCDIPPGVWHSVVCLEKDSVFLETKPGPYQKIETADFAPWAPREGEPACNDYHSKLEQSVRSWSSTKD